MAELTPRQQLADTEKQIAELTAKADALKEQTRATDLAMAKELIKLHSFTSTDLRPELKTRVPAKTSTAKKSTSRRKKG